MDDKAYTHIFYDIYNKVLQLSENPSQFAEYLTLQIRELIGTRTVVVAIKTETGQTKIFSVYPQRRKEWVSQSEVIKLAELSFNNTTVQYLDKEKCDHNCSGLLTDLEIEKMIAIPLIAGNRTIGSILLLDIMDNFGIESVIKLLNELSGVFALVIRNAYLYHEMENLVTIRTAELQDQNWKLVQSEQELKAFNEEYQVLNEELTETLEKTDRINKELVEANIRVEKSELQAREILQTAMDGFLLINLDGRFKDVNEVACKMLGYGREELLAMSISDIEYSETGADVKQRIEKIKKEGKDRFETKHRCKNGNIIDVEVSVVMQSSQNQLVVFVHDITQRKIVEKELIRKEQDLKKAQHIAHLGSWYLDIATNNVTWTEELYKMYGFDPTQPVPPYTEHMKLFTFASWEILSTSLAETRETGIPYELELKTIKKDGTNGWMWVRGEAVKDKNEIITGLWGAAQDITQYKQTEEDLIMAKEKAEENKQMFKAIADTSPLAIHISKGIRQVAEYINPRFLKLFGYEYEEVSEVALWWPLAYPDKEYRKQVSDQWNNNVAIAIQNKTGIEPMEVIVTCKDGSKKNILWGFVSTGNENWAFGMDLTSYRTTEQELIAAKDKAEESEEKHKEKHNLLSNFIKHTPIYSFIKHVEPNLSKVMYASENYVDMIGIPTSEIIDKTMYELFPHEFAKKITSDDWEVINNGRILVLDEDLNDKNYTTIKFPIVSENKKFLAGFTIDITERKKNEIDLIIAKEKAEESEQRFRSLIENAPDGVVILNESGKFIYVSPNAARLFGYSGNEVIGHIGDEFTHPDDLPLVLKTIETIFNNPLQTPIVSFRFRRKNGEYRWIETTFTNLLSDKAINGIILNFTDVTERRQILEDLVTAKEKAEESDRLKSAFLANMSHEIRTPMNGILGFTELLREPDLSTEQKEAYIDIVHQSGQRMLNTVNDIVEISKIEAGIVTVNLTEVDVQLRLDELMRFFTPEATKKGLKLIFENKVPKAVTVISTDQNKIDSIFTNLIKNAIKFTKAGEIRVGCKVHDNRLEFYVKDTGIGIPAERQQAIFERFIKADIWDKDAKQGSGLGLSITKAYVEMLGGEIRVESIVNQGSSFFFTLPLNWQVHEKAGKKENRNRDENTGKIKGLNIVIAEDDVTSAYYLQTILQTVSGKIILTKKGNETVETCRNNPGVDLVLMDIQMPKMNGYEATRQIRQFNTEVIIIALTAFALAGDRGKAMDAGCNDYIAKPIDKETLLKKIQMYF